MDYKIHESSKDSWFIVDFALFYFIFILFLWVLQTRSESYVDMYIY